MPPRTSVYIFSRLRSFHTSATHAAEETTSHYDTLNLPPHATRVEIKRRYFELSKAHHPDRNRNDPQASKRFIKISTAYAILGSEKHREKYDRDLSRLHGLRPSSYSNPVGARPASGLSRRRTQFHGPPPSFFRNGGWSTFKGNPIQGRSSSGGEGGGFGVGGVMTGRNDDVPHFNFGQKYRQHEQQQNRWAHRARTRRVHPEASIIFPLIGVTTILLGVISVVAYSSP